MNSGGGWVIGYADVYTSKLHVSRFDYVNFRVLFVIRGTGKIPAHDRIASMIDAYNTHARALIPPGAFLFADYDELMQHSPLGGVWVNGTGEKAVLVPRLS